MVTFTARRSAPELVVPAGVTPREVKCLSDVDNQLALRTYITHIEFIGCRVPGGAPQHPASSLKKALAETLVHYYPMAGRLRELPGSGGKKLVVDCTAEGVVFVEAHADVRLVEFGKPVVPPYPCVEEFMCDVGDPSDVIGKPLIYTQVTQLRCGGLVLTFAFCHSMVDAFGIIQIFRCILDLARGQALPAVLPVWERHLLVSSSEPPYTTAIAAAATTTSAWSTAIASQATPPALDVKMVTRSFLFGASEMAAIRSRVPGSFTAFELITAAVWRCRVAALEYAPQKRVRLVFPRNARGSWKSEPRLPPGFYGNATFFAVAEGSADEVCRGAVTRAAELVHEARLKVTNEQVTSDLRAMASGEYSIDFAFDGVFIVSDVSSSNFMDRSLDLGSWAEHVARGTPGGSTASMDALLSIYTTCKDINGEECVTVPITLPELAMGRFTSQIAAVTTNVLARSSM